MTPRGTAAALQPGLVPDCRAVVSPGGDCLPAGASGWDALVVPILGSSLALALAAAVVFLVLWLRSRRAGPRGAGDTRTPPPVVAPAGPADVPEQLLDQLIALADLGDSPSFRAQAEQALATAGASAVAAAPGTPFDPRLHRAVSASPTSSPAAHRTVESVVRVGWRLPDRVLRPADVVVAMLPENGGGPGR